MAYYEEAVKSFQRAHPTSKKYGRPCQATTSGECALPTPTKRTHAHIEGDLKAATREVERLQAELAAVPAKELVLTNVNDFDGVRFERSTCGNLDVTAFRGNGARPDELNILWAEKAAELRDWLNYYFPKDGAA